MSSKFVVYNTGNPVEATSSFSDAIGIANQFMSQQSLMRDYIYIHDESTDEIFQQSSSNWIKAGTLSEFVVWIAFKMQFHNSLTKRPPTTSLTNARNKIGVVRLSPESNLERLQS